MKSGKGKIPIEGMLSATSSQQSTDFSFEGPAQTLREGLGDDSSMKYDPKLSIRILFNENTGTTFGIKLPNPASHG